MDFKFVWEHLPSLLRGLQTTVSVSLILLVFVNIVGVLGALARTSRIKLLRWVTAAYVEIARNVPELVQIYFVFFCASVAWLQVQRLYVRNHCHDVFRRRLFHRSVSFRA